jgi:N-acetyl-D-muramate 6-phosphate phosphatase
MRMDRVETMLFDMDGTLIDTAADFIHVVEQLCHENNRPAPGYTEIHQTVSEGARGLVQLAFGLEADDPQCGTLRQRLLDIYAEQIKSSRAVLYPGMRELLHQLKDAGISWGIVTNKPETYSVVLLEQLNLDKLCDVLICPEHVRFTKPHPEPVLLALSRLNKSANSAVYVGDHPRDIESGRQAGLFTIAAAYGYLSIDPPVQSWGADMIVNTVSEITSWLSDLRTADCLT